ncbi:hypothetical protein TNCV_1312841 [Trichonephila clavipes]|nr:hypothetical protein TNCV_1312841 [Trichonephila clavipes]
MVNVCPVAFRTVCCAASSRRRRSNTGHACSHPRVPRAHQVGLSRRSLAGVGLSESVRCHGAGLALLTNGGAQQQQQHRFTLHVISEIKCNISQQYIILENRTSHNREHWDLVEQ